MELWITIALFLYYLLWIHGNSVFLLYSAELKGTYGEFGKWLSHRYGAAPFLVCFHGIAVNTATLPLKVKEYRTSNNGWQFLGNIWRFSSTKPNIVSRKHLAFFFYQT